MSVQVGTIMMLRHFSAILAVAAIFIAPAALAQDATMSGSYSAPGVVPGGTVRIAFGIWTNEVSNAPMSNGGFTYVVPAGLTATGFTPSIHCPEAGSTLVGNTLTIQGLSEQIGFICEITLDLTADVVGTYPLSPATLEYTTTGPGSFEMSPGSNSSLVVTYAPVVGGLSPAWGSIEGGDAIQINGANFTNATGVTIGGQSAPFTVESDTLISIVTPPHSKGRVDVVVTGISGVSANTTADDFNYVTPVPTLTEWAMILFGLLLAGVAASTIQRRRTA